MSGISRIRLTLGAQAVQVKEEKQLDQWVNRIVTPVIRALLQTANRLSASVVASSSSITLDGSEGFVPVDASTGPKTVTLSKPTALFHGVVIQKVDSSANAVTVVGPSPSTINGAASVALTSQWSSVSLLADDANFYAVPRQASVDAFVALLEVPFGTTNPSTNDVFYTVPASPSGAGRFVLEAFEVWSAGIGGADAGTVTLTMGASSGGNEYMLAQAITSVTPAGIQGGLALASLGTSMLINNGYRAALSAGAAIHLTATTSVGSVSADKKARAFLYGTFQP